MTPRKTALAWIKRGLFFLCLLPLARLFWLGLHDELGANPVEFVEHSTGTWTLVALLLCLTVTPLRLLLRQGWLITFRRMLGLMMFFYACLHLLAYIWLDHWFDWSKISIDILKHPYVLVGFLAWLLSIPLALTSTDAMMRKMKGRWKTLHFSTYVIGILAILHYWWLVKKDISQPLIYALILFALLCIRIYYKFIHEKYKIKL